MRLDKVHQLHLSNKRYLSDLMTEKWYVPCSVNLTFLAKKFLLVHCQVFFQSPKLVILHTTNATQYADNFTFIF